MDSPTAYLADKPHASTFLQAQTSCTTFAGA